MDNYLNIYNKVIKIYPYKIKPNELINLSHLVIISQNFNLKLYPEIDIKKRKVIFTNENRKEKIHSITTKNGKIYSLNEYIELYIKYSNKKINPMIQMELFNFSLNTYNYLKSLCIVKINDDIIPSYIVNTSKYDPFDDLKLTIIKKENHFYFDSFNINGDYNNLSIELNRLILNRDKYNEIHLHLENNKGGDLVPVHLLIRCFAGNKEDWMKPIKKKLKNKKQSIWNCWNEENKNSPNYMSLKKLKINKIPNFETNIKYKGKIYLYMTKTNGSAVHFFITYLIYLFVKNEDIIRTEYESFGDIIKFGSIKKNDNLVLIGQSGTNSGDCNAIKINFENIEILCPTEQFVDCSMKIEDYNRFWTE